jgi:hypothetical protein
MARTEPPWRIPGVLAAAAIATAAAWAIIARLPPMTVRVGVGAIASTVPLDYQLSVFPTFGAFAGALALDVVCGQERRSVLPRVALLAVTSLAALSRLAGQTPLSGHALFLFAAIAYEVAPPAEGDAPVSLALVIPALLVVGWYKLVVWGDGPWFAASAVLGLALGAALARAARS